MARQLAATIEPLYDKSEVLSTWFVTAQYRWLSLPQVKDITWPEYISENRFRRSRAADRWILYCMQFDHDAINMCQTNTPSHYYY